MDTIEPRKQTRECSNLSGQHSSIGRSLITISLHFHATGHPELHKLKDAEQEEVDRTPADGFPAREVSDVHKGVVERGKDVRNAEHQLAVPHLE